MRPISKHIVDYIVLILEFTYFLSLTKVYSFDLIPFGYNIPLLCFMAFAHNYRFGFRFPITFLIRNTLFLKIYILIFVIDLLQISITGSFAGLERILLLINMLLLWSYMYNIIQEERSVVNGVNRILSPYLIYSYYNVIVVILTAILVYAGLLSPSSNVMSDNSLIHSNLTEYNANYAWPGYLSVVDYDSFRMLSVLNIPVLSGLSHEPHVLCYLILPALFWGLNNIKKTWEKFLLLVSFVLTLCISFSTTAILTIVILLVLELIWNSINSKQIKNLILILLFIAPFLYFDIVGALISEQVETKLSGTSDGSMDYSTQMLKYIVSPKSLIGYGNLPERVDTIYKYDIGILTSILDITLYVVSTYQSFKLVFSKSKLLHYFGMGFVYYFIHGLKVNILMFQYPYFAFIIFLLAVINNNTKVLAKYDILTK